MASLQETHPEIAASWHSTLNGELTPADVASGSNKKYYWVCGYNHVYFRSVKSKTVGKLKCPICMKRELLVGANDMATLFPHLVDFFDVNKNKNDASHTIAKLNNKYWFTCDKNHSFETSLNNLKEAFSCTVCSGKRVLAGFNDIATTHPELLAKWHPTKNLPILPTQVSKGSHIRIWWVCDKGHEWQAMIYGIFGCSKCFVEAKLNKKPFTEKHTEVAKLWNYTKNSILIDEAYLKDLTRYNWVCEKGHEWVNTIANQVERKSQCQECKKEATNNTAHNNKQIYKSMPKPASKMDYILRYYREGTPDDLSKINVIEPINWQCYKCDTVWLASKGEMLTLAIQTFHECGKTKRKLFKEHPELLLEWHPIKNNGVTKEVVNVGSMVKYWWLCSEGHEWQTGAINRHKGQGCRYCSSTGFKDNKPAVLYFIEHVDAKSFKVGITGTNSDRLHRFETLGWHIVYKIEYEKGVLAQQAETQFFRWIRHEKQIPRHLTKKHFGYIGGASETFSSELISKDNVLEKIEEIVLAKKQS